MRKMEVLIPRNTNPRVVPIARPIIPSPAKNKIIDAGAATAKDINRFKVFIARNSTASTIERSIT